MYNISLLIMYGGKPGNAYYYLLFDKNNLWIIISRLLLMILYS